MGAATQGDMQVMRHMAVFDFFGAMPAERVEQNRIDIGRIQGFGFQHPFAEDTGEMFNGRDGANAMAQPSGLQVFCQAPCDDIIRQADRVIAQQRIENEIHFFQVGIEFNAVPAQTGFHGIFMGTRMNGFLADEALHILAQFSRRWLRQRLVLGAAKPEFAFRQQQVNGVDDVGRFRIMGNPVQRTVGEIKTDAAWQQFVSGGHGAALFLQSVMVGFSCQDGLYSPAASFPVSTCVAKSAIQPASFSPSASRVQCPAFTSRRQALGAQCAMSSKSCTPA